MRPWLFGSIFSLLFHRVEERKVALPEYSPREIMVGLDGLGRADGRKERKKLLDSKPKPKGSKMPAQAASHSRAPC